MAASGLTASDVLAFWFDELTPADWFRKSDELDHAMASRFGFLHEQAIAGELDAWPETPEGALALVILLDQFSRNLYRDTARAFASDQQALAIAMDQVKQGADQRLNESQRVFLYMPYMHSEDLAVHEQAVVLFEALGREDNLKFELKHKIIIERFGRYPHRNQALGRASTEEEIAFLQEPGSSF